MHETVYQPWGYCDVTCTYTTSNYVCSSLSETSPETSASESQGDSQRRRLGVLITLAVVMVLVLLLAAAVIAVIIVIAVKLRKRKSSGQCCCECFGHLNMLQEQCSSSLANYLAFVFSPCMLQFWWVAAAIAVGSPSSVEITLNLYNP